ncbi:hypothetical protein J6590_050850 [Homalodisca vitripennis]|nr:hypothetical protein J6590_050850 [Homalodisca vitripennis]
MARIIDGLPVSPVSPAPTAPYFKAVVGEITGAASGMPNFKKWETSSVPTTSSQSG